MGWFLPLGDGWFQPLLGCVHDFRAFEAASVRCFNTAYCKNTVSSGMTGLVGTSALPVLTHPTQEEICGISRTGLWGKSCVGCKSQQEAAM